ncbi:MAG: helix-turn-helix domain-containing protein [Anaerolineae bacterium]|nr:helix-turn-helix domain-containing protein [Anaerolineae bacterium]
MECPHCHGTEKQVKAGKTRSGNQRYKCQPCQRWYTPVPRDQGYPDETRQQALRLYSGMNFRRIARQLEVSHTSVMNWVKAAADTLPDLPPVPTKSVVIEEDELFTFIGNKKTKSTS